MTNELAYYTIVLITAIICFIVQAQGLCQLQLQPEHEESEIGKEANPMNNQGRQDGAVTISIATPSMMTLGIVELYINKKQSVILPNVAIWAFMLSVVTPSVIILNAVMLSVVAHN